MATKTATSSSAAAGWLRRLWPLALLVLLIGLAWALGLNEYLSFSALREHNAALQSFVGEWPLLAPLVFLLVYAAAIAASLPGGLILSLTGGFLFGTVLGLILVVSGATLGAVLVFLVARTSLGEPLRKKAGPWLGKMSKGFQEDAWSYLLFLRLVPVFPFWLVNLVPAFLGVPLLTYALATFIGIAPASIVFTSVGNGLGEVLASGQEPGADIVLQPSVLLPLVGLAVLSLVPVVWKRLRARRQKGSAAHANDS